MARLDQERQAKLTPNRFQYAIDKLHDFGIPILTKDDTKLQFKHKGETVTLYPYSGWHTGKSIKDGRGIELLLSKLSFPIPLA